MSLCVVGLVSAQPVSELPAADPRASGNATTTIPVTVPGGTEVMDSERSESSSAPASVAVEQPIDPKAYVCGVGDTFELNFWGQQNFRLRIAADLEGRVFISKVGFVDVAGKSLATVRNEVTKRVRANYPGLRFELTLVAPRTFLVHVAKNVRHPGSYSATPLERVSVVLARAGGATGSRRQVSIKHKNGSVTTADLLAYERTGDTSYNPYVLDGDVITVPFAERVVTITGSVRRPGTYELVKSKDLAELLALAGGFTSDVARTLPVRIVRRNDAQHEIFVDLPYKGTEAPNAPLLDDDRVFIRGADELQRTVQILGAVAGADSLDAATSAKRLPFVEGDTVLSLIGRAGGIKAPGDLKHSYISRPRSDSSSPELIPLDLETLLVRRDFRADKPLQIGDMIVIPPMQFSVKVDGAVAHGGLYPYNPKFGIAEYIAQAGGRTRSARGMDEVKLVDSQGRSQGFSRALKPSPGDAILVPERDFTRPEVVQIVLSAAGIILSGVAITLAATR